MVKTRKKGEDATLEYYPRPGYPGMPGPGYPGMPGSPGNMGIALATAYVPPQVFSNMYPLSDALHNGTLFPELYRPYPQTS
jgi:hypothetical protein